MRKDERGRTITMTTIKQKLTAEELENMVRNHGEQWVIDHWTMLEDQLEYI